MEIEYSEQLEQKLKKTCIVRQSCGGFYGDGNSCYWSSNTYIDLEGGKLYRIEEESMGGQMAEAHGVPSNVYLKDPVQVSDLRMALLKDQKEALGQLMPLIESGLNKTYNIRSDKQYYFFMGRLKKAKGILEGTDCIHWSEGHGGAVSVHAIALGKSRSFYIDDGKLQVRATPIHTVLRK